MVSLVLDGTDFVFQMVSGFLNIYFPIMCHFVSWSFCLHFKIYIYSSLGSPARLRGSHAALGTQS